MGGLWLGEKVTGKSGCVDGYRAIDKPAKGGIQFRSKRPFFCFGVGRVDWTRGAGARTTGPSGGILG